MNRPGPSDRIRFVRQSDGLCHRGKGADALRGLAGLRWFEGVARGRRPGLAVWLLTPAVALAILSSSPLLRSALASFSPMSFRLAYLLWGGVNATLAVLAVVVLLRTNEFGGRLTALGLLAAAAFLPLPISLLHGESQAGELLLLALALWTWMVRRQGLAGMLAGLGLVKPHLVLLPLLFVTRRAWRALLAYAGVAVLVFAVSMAAFGRGRLDRPGIGVVSVGGMLEAAFGRGPLGLAMLLAALLVAAIAISWRPHRPRLDMALTIAFSLVLTPGQSFGELALLTVPGFALAGLLRSHELRWPQLGLGTLALSYALVDLAVLAGPVLAGIGAAVLAVYLAAERLAVPPEPLSRGEFVFKGPRPKRVVVLPAYHAERTLRDVVARIPRDEVDRILLVDDASSDRTAEVALELAIDVIKHPRNLGYGGNQKTCYANALLIGAEVVVMLHPDGQYDPSLVPSLCRAVEERRGDVVLGSRWLGLDPAKAGMPWWKRLGNRFLTWTENRVLGLGLSEYHTGYRAYSRRFLETVPFAENDDDFVFDTQILVQAASFGFRVAEIPAVGRYFRDASSVGFLTSVTYGLKTLLALGAYAGCRAGVPCRWLTPRRTERRESIAA